MFLYTKAGRVMDSLNAVVVEKRRGWGTSFLTTPPESAEGGSLKDMDFVAAGGVEYVGNVKRFPRIVVN